MKYLLSNGNTTTSPSTAFKDDLKTLCILSERDIPLSDLGGNHHLGYDPLGMIRLNIVRDVQSLAVRYNVNAEVVSIKRKSDEITVTIRVNNDVLKLFI